MVQVLVGVLVLTEVLSGDLATIIGIPALMMQTARIYLKRQSLDFLPYCMVGDHACEITVVDAL